ncbi:MAG: hypothetical protein KIT57_12540 [Blastocatellales bacterium]|nr:hypothetical protein [Blastocatellales bacterium]
MLAKFPYLVFYQHLAVVKKEPHPIYIIIYSIGLAVFTSGTLFSSQSWLLADARKLSEVPQASQQAGSIYIPNIITRDLQGKQVDIKLTGTTKPTVIYIFESRCMWSASNYSNIKRLAEEVGDKYNFIGISLSDHKLENYIAAHPFQFPIFKTLLPTQHTKEVSLGVVPQTIVISRTGKTTKRWLGVYAGDVAREIEQFFRIKLPGLTVDGPPNAQPLNCSFCLDDSGLLYSQGAKILNGNRSQICKPNGQWGQI